MTKERAPVRPLRATLIVAAVLCPLLVSGASARLIRRRETMEDQLRSEIDG